MTFFEKETNRFLDGYGYHEYTILEIITRHIYFDILVLVMSAHFFYIGKMIAGCIIIMAIIFDAIFMQKLLIKMRRKNGHKYYGTKFGNYLNFASNYYNHKLMYSSDELEANAVTSMTYLIAIIANIVIIICHPFSIQPKYEFAIFATAVFILSFFWVNFNTGIKNIIIKEDVEG